MGWLLGAVAGLIGVLVGVAAWWRRARSVAGLGVGAPVGRSPLPTKPPTVPPDLGDPGDVDVTDLLRRGGGATSSDGSAPAIADAEAALTAIHPRTVAPQTSNTLLVFAHRTTPFWDEHGHLQDPYDLIGDLTQREFPDAPHLLTRSDDLSVPLRHGVELKVTARLEGAAVWPEAHVQPISEPVQRLLFRFRFERVPPGGAARGEVCAMVGPIVVAVVPVDVRVSLGAGGARPALTSETASTYHKVFASYSHRDVAIVEEIERAATALGLTYLRDIRDLRSGEQWDERLLGMIDGADVFQLFWSSNSMRSPHVRREWEHALSLGRPGFVRPLRWEDPLPTDPEAGLPPAELQRLHFHHHRPRAVGTQPLDPPGALRPRRSIEPPPPPSGGPSSPSPPLAPPPPPRPTSLRCEGDRPRPLPAPLGPRAARRRRTAVLVGAAVVLLLVAAVAVLI